MKKLNLLFCFLLFSYGLSAQNAGEVSEIKVCPLNQEITVQPNSKKWATSVRPSQYRKHTLPEIEAIKAEKALTKKLDKDIISIPSKEVATPIIESNFEGNWSTQGFPPDNAMAISNGGAVVAANNDGIEYYTTTGGLAYSEFWTDFFNNPNLTAQIYDPKLIYDPVADRFILTVLHGTTPATSAVLVSFSKTNNPLDGWWNYAFSGNALNDNSWFDYPNLGLTNNEVFVTGNLFDSNNQFNEAIIYQINKNDGYAGNSINFQIWSQLSNSPFSAFTLVPATNGHSTLTGPGMYFVSNKSGGSNQIILWEITNSLGNNPQITQDAISTTTYSPAADANQQGSNETISNGDCRIQSAFFLNGLIHFVFHADVGSGWNGLHYNRLNVSSQTNVTSSFGQVGQHDNSYPTVASFSNSTSNKSVMIGYLSSSGNKFPEMRVVNCDDNMIWSNSTLVKAGETFVNALSGNERWGDYSAISRRHNSSTPKIWIAGCYGANIQQVGLTNVYKSWIAEISGNDITGIESVQNPISNLQLFPVPTYDFLRIKFNTTSKDIITITVNDMNGKRIKTLYKDVPKTGENQLAFNKGALGAGTYFVRVSSPNKIFKNEKIIILD